MSRVRYATRLVLTLFLSGVQTLSAQESPDASAQLPPDIQRIVSQAAAVVGTPEPEEMPLGWNRGLLRSPLGFPVEKTGAESPNFLRLGAGLPGQTIADVNYGYAGRVATIGGFMRHAGQYGDIVNDLGFRNNAKSGRNRFGMFLQSGGEVKLDAELIYRHDVWARYGQFNLFPTQPEGPVKSSMQNYSSPTFRLRLGHDFTDLSELNFAVSAEAYYLEDGYRKKESGGQFAIDLAQTVDGMHELSLQTVFDATIGNNALDDHENFTFRISPFYGLKVNDFHAKAGVNALLDLRKEFESMYMVMPRLYLAYTGREDRWKPYLSVESELIRNSFNRLTTLNPYVSVDSLLPLNTRRTEFRLGMEGKLRNGIAYNLYWGVNTSKHAVVFVNSYVSGKISTFRPLREARLRESFVGVKISSQVTDRLWGAMAAHVYSYKTKSFEYPSGLPKYDLELWLSYAITPRLTAGGGMTLIGPRHFQEYWELEEVELSGGATIRMGEVSFYKKEPAAADLRLDVQYRWKESVTLFVEGHNLAGQKLYNYYHYPHRGATVNLGVRADF